MKTRCRLYWLTNSALVYEPKCMGMGGGWGCGVSANEYSCALGAQIKFGDLTPYLTYGENSSRNLFGGAIWRSMGWGPGFSSITSFLHGGEMTEIVHRVDGGNQHQNYGFHIKASRCRPEGLQKRCEVGGGGGGGEGAFFSLLSCQE